MIPKIIHYIWLEEKIIPASFLEYLEEIKKLNPSFKHIYWGRELIEKYKNDKSIQLYLKEKNNIDFITNKIKLLTLKEFGGIFLNLDLKYIKSFDKMYNQIDVENISFLSLTKQKEEHWQNPWYINFELIGSSKNSRLIDLALKANTLEQASLNIMDNMDYDVCFIGKKYFNKL